MRGRKLLSVFIVLLWLSSVRAQTLHFAVLGDNRTPTTAKNRYEQPEAFLQNIQAINRLRPAFAIIVGDLILGDADSAMVLKQWDYFDQAVSRFEVPVKLVVGNHDVRNAWTARIFENRYGPMNYAFTFGSNLFIVLNSEEPGRRDRIEGRQLEWLRQRLEAADGAKHIFVFLHKPLWKPDYNSNWNRDVHPLLATHGVTAVFAGHEHHYEDCGIRDGVHYFITGGGGAELDRGGEGAGGFYHFMWVSVDTSGVEYAVVRPEAIASSDVVTSKDVGLWREVESETPVLFDLSGVTPRARLRLRNPASIPVEVTLTWGVPPGSKWRVGPEEIRVPVMPRDSVTLRLPLTVDPENFFPLPRYEVSYTADGRRLLHLEATPHLKPDGFVRRWLVIGPFDLMLQDEFSRETPPGFLKAYPPEREIRLQKSYRGVGGEVRWRSVEARSDGYVDLAKAIQHTDRVVAYALTFVKAPRDLHTQITLGSNDGARVWLNDELVFSRHVGRGAAPDQDVVPVTFRKGWNKLLVKVENLGLSWGFYLRVADVQRELILDPYGPLARPQ